VKGNVVETTCF